MRKLKKIKISKSRAIGTKKYEFTVKHLRFAELGGKNGKRSNSGIVNRIVVIIIVTDTPLFPIIIGVRHYQHDQHYLFDS